MARRASAAVAEFSKAAAAKTHKKLKAVVVPQALQEALQEAQQEALKEAQQEAPEAHSARESAVVSHASFAADPNEDPRKDHFIVKHGTRCAGAHLIADFYDTDRLDDLQLMEQAFITAVKAAGATLLHIHMHHFTPNGGISGVAVLAESHISVHTWPERRFAAFDVFMCGNAKPEVAIEVLRQAFKPGHAAVNEYLRGRVSEAVDA